MHPGVLAAPVNFVSMNNHFFVQGVDDPALSKKALLVSRRVDRKSLCVVFALIMLLSLGAGLSVAFICARADLGMAVGSLLVTVLSCLEVLLVWFLK